MKKGFVLYNDYKDQFESLSGEEAKELIIAIFEYSESEKIKALSPVVNAHFSHIKKELDRQKDKFLAVCERNKNNGFKGGRPKHQNNPNNPVGFLETQNNPEKPKKANTNTNTNTNTKENISNSRDYSLNNLSLTSGSSPIFKKPSVADVANYCNEKNLDIDPEAFCDFYESKNWFVGKNKMKCWQSACRNWARMQKKGVETVFLCQAIQNP